MAEKTGEKPPESPTTARELDFDDDDAPANMPQGPAPTSAPAAAPASAPTAVPTSAPAAVPDKAVSPKPGVHFSDTTEEIPPTKPPRPMSPQQQAHNTLIEAFPDIDTNVVKAVLVASGGNVEPAFHALLTMSDPDAQRDDTPPPQPPRPQPRSQLEQDELYARQLAEHYNQQGQQQQQGQRQQGQRQQQQQGEHSEWPNRPQRRQTGPRQHDDDDREHSFFDDDLPEIRKNIEQGFLETQKTVNKWITTFKKKLDGEPDEYDEYGNPVPVPHGADKRRMQQQQHQQQRRDYGPSTSDQLHAIRKNAEPRRSADHTRYDADNRVLGDDFAQLELRDNDAPPRARPTANPDLFKPTPVSPPQSGPVDEVDALYRNPSPNSGVPGAKASGKKWQPLTSVAPHPEPDEHDPFSLGDSDDEEARTKDLNPEDSERLKKAAQTKQPSVSTELEPARRSGSVGQKDAAAEALLSDAK